MNHSPNSINEPTYLKKITYDGVEAESYYIEAEEVNACLQSGKVPDIRIRGESSGPVIAVILGQDKHPDRREKDYSIHSYYVDALTEAGACPRFVVYDKVEEQLAQMKPDGILLIGGCFDLPRDWYSDPKPADDLDKRGSVYLQLIDYAQAHRLALLGICGGMQALAGKFGAKLKKGVSNHAFGGYKIAHKVIIEPNSLLAEIEGTAEIMTNSAHKEAVIDGTYAESKITARAEDGTVEAVELKNPWHPFVLGVQWHPEFFFRNGNKTAPNIFTNFIKNCHPAFDNLVELKHERFITELMYADTKHNMTGRPVYQEIGFGNRALVHKDLSEKLLKLIPYLEKNRLKLKVFDAYRPPLAHEKLREVIPQPGFFALDPAISPHCRGTAIDVALCDEAGVELPYPTEVDAYTPHFATEVQNGRSEAFFQYLVKARHDYEDASIPEKIKNRNDLRGLMEGIGLKPLPHEWWHYELYEGRTEKYPMIR